MAELLKLVKRRDIAVYLTPWCWQGQRDLARLQEWGLPYGEVDVSKDEAAARQVEAWNNGFRSVPTFAYCLVVVEPRDEELRHLLHEKVRIQSADIYCTSWCPHCRLTKAYLEHQGIPYREISIEGDARAAAQVEEWTGGFRSVPTLVLRLLLTEPTPSQLAAALGVVE